MSHHGRTNDSQHCPSSTTSDLLELPPNLSPIEHQILQLALQLPMEQRKRHLQALYDEVARRTTQYFNNLLESHAGYAHWEPPPHQQAFSARPVPQPQSSFTGRVPTPLSSPHSASQPVPGPLSTAPQQGPAISAEQWQFHTVSPVPVQNRLLSDSHHHRSAAVLPILTSAMEKIQLGSQLYSPDRPPTHSSEPNDFDKKSEVRDGDGSGRHRGGTGGGRGEAWATKLWTPYLHKTEATSTSGHYSPPN